MLPFSMLRFQANGSFKWLLVNNMLSSSLTLSPSLLQPILFSFSEDSTSLPGVHCEAFYFHSWPHPPSIQSPMLPSFMDTAKWTLRPEHLDIYLP
jgi:hypothetical protein